MDTREESVASPAPMPPARQPYPVQVAIWSNILLLSVGLPLPEGFPGASLTASFFLTALASLFIATPDRPGFVSTRVIVASVVAAYGLFAFFIGPCTDGALRVIFSAGSFVALIWVTRRLASIVRFDVPLLPMRHARLMLLLISAAVVVHAAIEGIGPGLRVGGLYREPSHLALATAPLLFYMWKAGGRLDKIVVAMCGVPLLAFAYSSTLLALVMAMFALEIAGGFVQEGRRGSAVFGFIGVAILVAGLAASPLITPTVERVTGVMNVSEDENISSLVYVNGWQMLFANMESSGGAGIGFNAMGCEPRPITFAMTLLDRQDHGDLNYNDGSFLVSKIGSELGVPGLVVWLVFPWLTVVMVIRRFDLRRDTQWLCFAWLLIISIGAVIRSTGYFTGSVTLGLLGAFIAWRAFPSKRRAPVAPALLPKP